MIPGVIAFVALEFLGHGDVKQTWKLVAALLAWIALSLPFERFRAAQYQREIDALSALNEDAGSISG
jgi:hypothetical protein